MIKFPTVLGVMLLVLILSVIHLVLSPMYVSPTQSAWLHRRSIIPLCSNSLYLQEEEALRLHDELDKGCTALREEQWKLHALVQDRDAHKIDWVWFFDTDKLIAVEKAQMPVSEQQRKVMQSLDNIHLVWSQLKPLYGPKSMMLVRELVGSFGQAHYELWNALLPSRGISLLSLLVAGPGVAFLMLLWMLIGFAMLPVLLLLTSLGWLAHLPVLLLQYRPTAIEFFAIHLACTVLVGAFLYVTCNAFQQDIARAQLSQQRGSFFLQENSAMAFFPLPGNEMKDCKCGMKDCGCVD